MRPQNKTWAVFAGLLFLNLPLFILGIVDIFDGWPLYLVPLWQAGWLYSLANTMGFDVYGKANDFAVSPNFLGWFFVIIGSTISLIVNYLIAKFVTKSFESSAK